MPAIGSGFFTPSGQWAFPRSYVYGISIRMDDWPVTSQDGNFFTLTQIGFPDRHVYFRFKEAFFEWSSNCYTLDWIVSESYFTNTVTGLDVPLGYALTTWIQPDLKQLFIQLSVPGFGATRHDDFPLPSAPPDYWLVPVA